MINLIFEGVNLNSFLLRLELEGEEHESYTFITCNRSSRRVRTAGVVISINEEEIPSPEVLLWP